MNIATTGTTRHAMGLALLGAKNTFGATIGTALGNIAVPEVATLEFCFTSIIVAVLEKAVLVLGYVVVFFVNF